MLKVSIHAGSYQDSNRFNRLAVLDIVYEQLAPVADYKVSLQERQQDVRPPRVLTKYPRWSASLWDLTARALALAIPDVLPAVDIVPEVVSSPKKRPFVQELCVTLEHVAGNLRTTLGSVAIKQAGRRRGEYVADFEEHTLKPVRTEPFAFVPEFLRPTELLLHACAHRLTGKAELPARPGLCVPPRILWEGEAHICVHQLVEPARTGFQLWLTARETAPTKYEGAPLDIVPLSIYEQFLNTAI